MITFNRAFPWLVASAIVIGFVYDNNAKASDQPEVIIHTSIKAGRYYMSIDGVRKKHPDNPERDQYWGLSTTAEAAAIQWAFETGKVVIIEQPDLTVTASFTVIVPDVPTEPEDPVAEPVNVLLSWSKPVERVDGSPLDSSAIAGYSIMMDEVVIAGVDGGVLEYTVEGLTPGIHYFSIATLAEQLGSYSPTINITIGD